MKKLLITTGILGASILMLLLYASSYVVIHPSLEEYYFLSPFQPTHQDFHQTYSQASSHWEQGDHEYARQLFSKALRYRNSRNESIHSNRFSCGNDFWQTQHDLYIKYATAYQHLGNLDSAMACLRPALVNTEKYLFPTDSLFFQLAIAKHGKQEVIDELEANLPHLQSQQGFMLCKEFFLMKGFKVGYLLPYDVKKPENGKQILHTYGIEKTGIYSRFNNLFQERNDFPITFELENELLDQHIKAARHIPKEYEQLFNSDVPSTSSFALYKIQLSQDKYLLVEGQLDEYGREINGYVYSMAVDSIIETYPLSFEWADAGHVESATSYLLKEKGSIVLSYKLKHCRMEGENEPFRCNDSLFSKVVKSSIE